MNVRRVVTGHNASGKSAFVSDDAVDPCDPGMHTTDTIDFEVVLEGTITLELDDGAEVALRPGDTVVQNGTRHRWKNAGDSVARFAVFICGASHAGIPPV